MLQINFTRPFTQNTSLPQRKHYCPGIKPLERDTVSFGAIKKSRLDGFSLAAANMFKAPIQQFDSPEDMQKWAQQKLDNLLELDRYNIKPHDNIHPEIIKDANNERMGRLKEWKDYITKENDAIKEDPSQALIVFSAITADLKSDNRELPPVLDRRALADTIDEISTGLKRDKNCQFDFRKKYEINARKIAMGVSEEECGTKEKITRWVKIPSYKNDPDNFDENVKKLKILSCRSWCTKSGMAEPYLKKGDFHVYLEKGKPKLGIRFVENEVDEIQGERNNRKIPLDYFDVLKQYTEENNFTGAEEQIEKAKAAKISLDKAKAELKPYINKKDLTEDDCIKIFEYFGIKTEKLENGLLRISEYRQPDYRFSYGDLRIKENDLFKHIEDIVGYADFHYSQVTDLGQLRIIVGIANFSNSQVTDLGQLREIGENADFRNSQITDLGQLRKIGKNVLINKDSTLDFSKINIGGKNSENGLTPFLKHYCPE